MMRQTNDCTSVWVMQHKAVLKIPIARSPEATAQSDVFPGRPSSWACGPRAESTWSSAHGSGPTLSQTSGFNP